MRFILSITRYDPSADREPRFERFTVDADPTDRILDALIYVKDRLDPTLGFRRSCAHGVCGSDAMRINGRERLACKTLVKEVVPVEGAEVTVEPLRGMRVLRDLIVDQGGFFASYREVKPFLMNDEPVADRERPQSPKQRARFDDQTNCILCASCQSACPVARETMPDFIGPAALVQAGRFLFDSRDRGLAQRLDPLDLPRGAAACESRFECTRVCPRGIKVTRNINEIKRTIAKHKEGKR